MKALMDENEQCVREETSPRLKQASNLDLFKGYP
jgi:hypothetical protein